MLVVVVVVVIVIVVPLQAIFWAASSFYIGTPEGLINIFHVGIIESYFKTQVSTELQSLI
jgi:hypothetical protein